MKRIKRLILVVLTTTILLHGCDRNNVNPETADMSTIQPSNEDSIDTEEGNTTDTSNEAKLKIIFTIDTEDKYGNVPNMIECDFADAGACGVDYIMDTFEQYDMRAVFFVNIYEHLRYSGEYDNYIENLVKEIDERGHEVGLHAHRDETLGFFNDELIDLSYEEQEQVIHYGIDFLQNVIGHAPISFRGGGYKVNDDTFQILEQSGIKYDSSYYYDTSGNTFKEYNSLNTVCKIFDADSNLIEFPVIRTIKRNGTLSKLDINSMTFDEIVDVLEEMKSREGYDAAQIMFHSFSFMDQKEQPYVTPYFHEGTHMGYGIHEGLTKRFTDLLEYIQNDPDIEVMTFEQYDALHPDNPVDKNYDGIFVCNSDDARAAKADFEFVTENKYYREPQVGKYLTDLPDIRWFVPQDVTITQNGDTIVFVNHYQPGLAQYAWYIKDCELQQIADKIMYSSDSVLTYQFDVNGHYQVKAFVRFDSDTKDSKVVADIYVTDEGIKVIPANPS